MHLELTEDQEFFRETTRRFLESETPLTTVRALYESVDGYDDGWWKRACELGWTSMYVPDKLGGGSLSGRPTCDAVIVAEEIGRLVAPGPFYAVNVVAAALARNGNDEQQALVLPALVSGEAVASWAFGEPGGHWPAGARAGAGEARTTLTRDGDQFVLHGTKSYVEAASVAQWFLVTANGGQVLVAADTPGVSVARGRSLDMTRRYGRVTFDNVRLPASAVVRDDVDYQRHVGLALQCAELVGVADRTLEFTLDYAKERFAFGRPIASFQALKHRIADMVGALEYAKAVSDELALAVDTDRSDVAMLASVAKAFVGEKCPGIVDDCVQITGGIGVTWEHDIHLYNRRSVVDRAVLGTPEEHKQSVCSLMEV